MAIDHLNPPTGQMADNVIGFARALRAAGIPVGPGAVIDALNALQVIEIGNRADVYATLEAIFVKRHEHALIFTQAFDLFFRAAEEWKSHAGFGAAAGPRQEEAAAGLAPGAGGFGATLDARGGRRRPRSRNCGCPSPTRRSCRRKILRR